MMMQRLDFLLITKLLLSCGLVGSVAAESTTFVQQKNVVFREAHGVGLMMDIFRPVGDHNGKAIVQVVSGGWDSSRSKIRDLEKARVFTTFCGHGYSVFAIRPGSLSKFSVPEMVENLTAGIVWVKQHASEFGIDAHKLAIVGASAGGHLASLVAVQQGRSTGSDDASVAVVGVFFPPTDFSNYGGQSIDPRRRGRFNEIVRRAAFGDDVVEVSDDEIAAKLKMISPAQQVTANTPPFLIFHGDADLLVPLQQSEVLLAALQAHDVPARLVVKSGGGHPWPTIHEEVLQLADWFDEQLLKESP